LAWVIWIPIAASTHGWLPFRIPTILYWLAGLAPISCGIIMTNLEKGKAGWRDLMQCILRWKIAIGWYALIILLPVLLRITTLGLFRLSGAVLPAYNWLQIGQTLLTGIVLFPLALFDEVGWRGYALPKLLER
jgi:hypothetical protein